MPNPTVTISLAVVFCKDVKVDRASSMTSCGSGAVRPAGRPTTGGRKGATHGIMWALGVKRENFSGAEPQDEKVLTRTLTKRHDDRRGQKVVLHLKANPN